MTIAEVKKGAGIILMRSNGTEYLLLKGRSTGIWSFSKGHTEIADLDTPLRTAVRETFEETGLTSGIDYTIIGNSMRFGKRPYWLGLVADGAAHVRLSQREHSNWAWLTWADICKIEMQSNTDVRCWIKKSRNANGEFMRLQGFVSSQRQEMRSTWSVSSGS